MSEYTLTLFEACEFLSKSKKTLGRYIRQGRLHPLQTKSKLGTLEYRFSREDLESFRQNNATLDTADEAGQTSQDQARQDDSRDKRNFKQDRQETTDKPDTADNAGRTALNAKDTQKGDETGRDKAGQGGDIIKLLESTVSLLKDQLSVKDKQIDSLSGTVSQLVERDRETNILLKGLQDRVALLEPPKQAGAGKAYKETEAVIIHSEPVKSEPVKQEKNRGEQGEPNKETKAKPTGKTGQDQKKKSFLSRLFS